MQIDRTKRELEIVLNMLSRVTTNLDDAVELIALRNKYKADLKK